jgi:hypothetical protein
MDSLHVTYAPKLITQRKRHVINLFARRFYSPYVLLVWIFTAIDITACDYVKVYVPILTILSSVHITRNKYVDWYRDLLTILEANNINLTLRNKIYFWVSEVLIQMIAFLLSVWWVDDLHLCVGPLKVRQGLLFIILLVLSFILHVMHYQYLKEYTEKIVKVAYAHVTNGLDEA